ncbi:MAG: hypothetical protein GY799_32460 [Desulfobulbaceae bacterium]|jgi:hypothetical protein|nr:hypothetical protein [Candidatus Brocadiaceae bacterium]MCP4343466.1 hypothetical protein [Desulfobulbaceae bacterium]
MIEEITEASGSFNGGQWGVLLTIVLTMFTALVWYFKYHTRKTEEAIERAKHENREYNRQRDAFRSSMFDSGRKQFDEMVYDLSGHFFKKIKEIDGEFKCINKNPIDRVIPVSRKSEPILHHNESDFKSRFHENAEKIFDIVTQGVIGCYDEYCIFKTIGPHINGEVSEVADTYTRDLNSRAEVYTKSLKGRLIIDTWSHEIVEASIEEVVTKDKVEKIIHSIFENFYNRESAIEKRSQDIQRH